LTSYFFVDTLDLNQTGDPREPSESEIAYVLGSKDLETLADVLSLPSLPTVIRSYYEAHRSKTNHSSQNIGTSTPIKDQTNLSAKNW